LRPQHFQQQALFFESSVAQSLRLTHGNPWGIRKATLDADALRGGVLRLHALDMIFRDGVQIDAPGETPLPLSRNLADISQIGADTVVYACLPTLNAFGGNSSGSDANSARPIRYIAARDTVRDLYTDALEAEVSTLLPNIRLMVEDENRDGHLCVAIARISKNANGAWEIDQEFIPPLLDVSGSPYLSMLVHRLLDILLVKSQSLAVRHREKVKSVVEYGTSDIASFWLLHTVNRNFPLLNHFAAIPTHPESLYELMAQLCGELMTFSSELTLGDIPAYNHENLTAVFARLDTLIRELLETVVSNRYALIPLDYYLSVSSELPTTEVLDMVPLKLKAGSPDDVEKILNSALPGVHLVHATQTPVALPVRVGNHYFVLEPQGQIFERMCKSRSICIYVPQALLGLKLELYAVFR